ncbi:hypothetical protein TIFTF001_018977 [Ficus carica]|uniref:Ubiquitin-like domain-containing protein n=1 Tax=Ficus carica TaxID=3494 RepID=A0AA88ADH6_FICCA|nr:hypothetical protein TIFTF001_018977 [Ficus carica]
MDLIFLPQKRRTFTIEVGFFDTVLEIKEKVEKYQGIPVSDQTLVFNGRALPEDGDIASCVLLHNSRINLVIASEANRTAALRLRVKIATPANTHVVAIEADLNDTVLNLKDKIILAAEEASLISSSSSAAARSAMVLHSKGREMQDINRSLAEYEVKDDGEIEVGFRRPASSKLKVVVESKCGTKRIPVEVNASGNVGDQLRKELRRLNQEQGFPLPTEYFFIHKQDVMDEDRSFRWHRVASGDTIEVFPGSVTTGGS